MKTDNSTVTAVQVDLVAAKREYSGLMDKYGDVLEQRNELLEALHVAVVAFHSLGNPASRTAQAMKRGRQSAKEHEGKARAAIDKVEGS